jgi:DNA-3-methyladenine glycosylase I
MLSLCSQQAGLNWRTIWTKRGAYRKAFHDFDMECVAAMTQDDILALIQKHQEMRLAGAAKSDLILCSEKKLSAIVHNAKLCVKIHREHEGGLSGFFWDFLPNAETIVNAEAYEKFAELEAREGENGTFGKNSRFSKALEAELKRKRGFKFLGSVTLQAFLLQNGLLNGHCPSCFCNSLQPGSVAMALKRQKEDRTRPPVAKSAKSSAAGKTGQQKGKRKAAAAGVKTMHAAGLDTPDGAPDGAPDASMQQPSQWRRKKMRCS